MKSYVPDVTPLREDYCLRGEEFSLAGNPVHVRHREIEGQMERRKKGV